MQKIVFIEPKNPNIHIFTKFKIPRLGSLILASLMKQKGWQAEVFIEDYSDLDWSTISRADIVAISTITPTAPRAYGIADAAKRAGCTIIMGGPHVTFMPEEALQHADYVFRGEGERSLTQFIDAFEKGSSFSKVPNLSYRDGEIIRHNPIEPHIENLDSLPFPDFSLVRGATFAVPGRQKTIVIQTSRGCPFSCSFCSVTGIFGKRYRYRSTESVIAEMRQYDPKNNFIFFCDDNFTHNKNRIKELLEAMIRENMTFRWSTQVRTDVANDPDLIPLMKKSGCHTVFIGFESVDPDCLEKMKKSQTVEQIQNAINEFHRNKIHIHGMFVFGFAGDNWQKVKDTIHFAITTKISSAQFQILTPLPGSEIFNELNNSGRIVFRDWSLYDTHHVVFNHDKMSPSDLQRAQIYGHSTFYSLKETIKKLFRRDYTGAGIACFARGYNREWKRQNRLFCKMLAQLSS